MNLALQQKKGGHLKSEVSAEVSSEDDIPNGYTVDRHPVIFPSKLSYKFKT